MEKAVVAILAGLVVFGLGKRKAGPAGEATSFKLNTPPVESGTTWLLPAQEVAQRVGATAKVLEREKLAVVCQGDRCASIPLDGVRARVVDGRLFLEQAAFGHALQTAVRYVARSGRVTVQRVSSAPQCQQETFSMKIGQQVPDIELTDLEGNSVHLSHFRGKRLAVFSWASW